MPQLVLEFSSNVFEKTNLNMLFQQCHSHLEKMLPTDINSCKSRAIECDTYYIGNGKENDAFIHLSLKVFPGRSMETFEKIGNAMMEILKNYFSNSLNKLNLQITIEIMELQKTYFKITS
jgi:5-carboxymethyl-2-hydroxymuconate isomerase